MQNRVNSTYRNCHRNLPSGIEICHQTKTEANSKCTLMPRTRSATVLALSWQCRWCSYANDSAKNKKHCRSFWAWRDRTAPLSLQAHGNMCIKAGGVGNVGGNAAGGTGGVGLLFCSSKSNSPIKASPSTPPAAPGELACRYTPARATHLLRHHLAWLGQVERRVEKRESLPLEAMVTQQYDHHFQQDCLRLSGRHIALSRLPCCCCVEAYMMVSLESHLPLLQRLCITLPISYSSGQWSPILE